MPSIHIGGRIATPTFLHNGDGLLYLNDPLDAKTGETLQVHTTNTDGKVEGQVEAAVERLAGNLQVSALGVRLSALRHYSLTNPTSSATSVPLASWTWQVTGQPPTGAELFGECAGFHLMPSYWGLL